MSSKVEVRLFPSARKPDTHVEKQLTDYFTFTINQLDTTVFQYTEQALKLMRSLSYLFKTCKSCYFRSLILQNIAQKDANTFDRRKGINAPFIIMRDFPPHIVDHNRYLMLNQ